jgi:hypothetical protein
MGSMMVSLHHLRRANADGKREWAGYTQTCHTLPDDQRRWVTLPLTGYELTICRDGRDA